MTSTQTRALRNARLSDCGSAASPLLIFAAPSNFRWDLRTLDTFLAQNNHSDSTVHYLKVSKSTISELRFGG